MSKWMNRLQEEMEKNKSASSQPLSVLSVPFLGLWEKNNEVLAPKIENPCFQPLSVLSVASRGLLEKKGERKSVINQQLSVLSVPDRGVSVKFYNVKNIEKDAYIPTDNTDIGSFSGEKNQHIDFSGSFADAIEMTRTRGKPKQIRESRWNAIVHRLDVLVDEEKPYLLKMIKHGWSLQDVFGCHQFAPEMRFDSMGLLMLLTNSRISEVHPERALLKSRSGQTMSYYLGAMNRNLPERSTLMDIE